MILKKVRQSFGNENDSIPSTNILVLFKQCLLILAGILMIDMISASEIDTFVVKVFYWHTCVLGQSSAIGL